MDIQPMLFDTNIFMFKLFINIQQLNLVFENVSTRGKHILQGHFYLMNIYRVDANIDALDRIMLFRVMYEDIMLLIINQCNNRSRA